jgi:hypothetical protein
LNSRLNLNAWLSDCRATAMPFTENVLGEPCPYT